MNKKHSIYILFFCNILESYNMALYGYLNSIMSSLFLPHIKQETSILLGLGIFIAGVMMKPLGGAIFGHIGDWLGRKKSLLLSILFGGISTFIIGIHPTYDLLFS